VMVDFSCFTDMGPRKRNEDSVFASERDDGSVVLAVADGLGGHFGGAEAAKIAIQALEKADLLDTADFQRTFLQIHEAILKLQSSSSELQGMATTLTAVKIDNFKLFGAHCGDTRCILQRGEGIKKLTVEHTEAQRLFDAGKLTKDQFLTYPRRNVLDNALGGQEELRVDAIEHDLAAGDKLLLTSDGVHEKLRLRLVLEILKMSNDSDTALGAIHSGVIERGPEDNFSAVCAFL